MCHQVMTKKCYTNTERDIGEMWGRAALNTAIVEAGRMERDIAIQNNSFCEGVPAITVIVDGVKQNVTQAFI